MTQRSAFLYSQRFGEFSYGEDHPFKLLRYRLAHELISELGLLASELVLQVECPLIEESDLLQFHAADYLQTLKEFSASATPRANFRFGLGDVENPVFPGVYDWARLGCGGTLEAARLVAEGEVKVAFSMAGGYHHSHPARASGFSYLNDAVVAIQALLRRGLRVAYVDIDAHHGDAVQAAFYSTDQVLTISLHETGENFFPQTGFVQELGEGRGFGYSVNIPFRAHSDDLIFDQAFQQLVMPLLRSYQPDILVTQMGVDGLRTDPLSRLELTSGSIEMAARAFAQTGIPWVALGGGGYDKFNVARCWTLLWAIMTGVPLPEQLPPRYQARIATLGRTETLLRDPPRLAHPDDFGRAQRALDQALGYLQRKLFPLHGLPPGRGF